jgi:hypothetical protein
MKEIDLYNPNNQSDSIEEARKIVISNSVAETFRLKDL